MIVYSFSKCKSRQQQIVGGSFFKGILAHFYHIAYNLPPLPFESRQRAEKGQISDSTTTSAHLQHRQKVKNDKSKKKNRPFVAYFLNNSYLCIVQKTNDMADMSFEVLLLEEAEQFLGSLNSKTREKITSNIRKVAGGVKDSDLFKKLDGSDGIWEFRTLFDGMQYRLFAFWDNDTRRLVVATHGIVKKAWKVPAREIAKAEEIRRKYYESK